VEAPPRRSTATAQSLPRSIVVSLITTALDFGTLWALVELLGASHALATFLGTVVGAGSNFLLSRAYAFDASGDGFGRQALRFLPVQAGSSGLQTLGVWLLADVLHLNYMTAKIGVAVAVYLGWNYPLCRFYVFARPKAAAPG
jgi:putative flippase GtrA